MERLWHTRKKFHPLAYLITNGGNIMYRDGNFQSLRWNMLEASHKAHWEKLSSVYGLEEPEKLLKSEAQKKDMPVLDQLAELCICSCQNYLFSLTPVKDVSNVFNDVLTAPDDLPRRIRRDMPHHFELALRDHLIVTFAYRFCCDNLEPRSFDDYVNTLFDYIAEFDKTANPIDLAEIRKNYRRDFRKDFRNQIPQLLRTIHPYYQRKRRRM